MKSILDNSFRYTPSFQTDVRKTFERLRSEQRQADLARVVTANGFPAKQPDVVKSYKA